MKREELTPIELECNMGPDVNGVVQREPWKAYDIDEVNLLLDEKDAEIAALKAENRRLRRALWLLRAGYASGKEDYINADWYDGFKKDLDFWHNVKRYCRAMAKKFK